MTVQQLKYILKVAEVGSITEAAKLLFISQPSLSNSIKETEKEAGITIFLRSRIGITLTNDGAEFLGYARQVIQQMELLEDRYVTNLPGKVTFGVSSQHYTFTENAFVELVKRFGQEPSYSSWYEAPKGGMQFREKLSIEYQVNKDYNNKNLRILKKVVEENIHPKNKVLISASQYVNVKNEYKKNIKACIFYQSYSIQLYEKDLFFDDKITTGKVKIPIGIVFIVSKDMKQLQNY